MIELVKKRGRAYHCSPCGYVENKHLAEAHFYKKHVAEFEMPFMCVTCDFRGEDAAQFQRYKESPGHSLMTEMVVQHSQAPMFIVHGEDFVRLTIKRRISITLAPVRKILLWLSLVASKRKYLLA